jgi:hypothetical protein
MRLPLPLITTTLCVVLGAIAGKWSQPAITVVEKPNEPAHAVIRSQAASLRSMPPPFTSVTASVEWVRAEMRKGNLNAVELLFRHDAGLTPEQRLALAKELVRDFRRYDPRSLGRIVLGLPPSEEADHLLWTLIATWSGADAEGVLHFIEALPADRLNTVGVLQNAAWGLCRLPADRVLAFAARLDEKGRAYIAEGLIAFANQAGSWRNTQSILDGLNVRPQKDTLTAEWRLGYQLAEIDPQAVESRIAAETDAFSRDELINGYASAISDREPARCLELLAQTSAPDKRAERITSRVEQWLTCDRATALAWLQGRESAAFMPAEQRTKLLKSYGLEAAR